MPLNAFIPHGLPQELNEIIINFVNTPHPCVKIINDFWETQRKVMKTSFALQSHHHGFLDSWQFYTEAQEQFPNFNYLNIDNYAHFCSHNNEGWQTNDEMPTLYEFDEEAEYHFHTADNFNKKSYNYDKRLRKKYKGINRYAEVHDAVFYKFENNDYYCYWHGSIPKNFRTYCEALGA